MLISLVIIHFNSLELWGEFTEALIAVNFLSVLLAFGNKDYLVRAFSSHPSTLNTQWNKIFWSRAPLLIFALVCLYSINNNTSLFLICAVWLILNFIQQSFDSLVLFFKNFRQTLLIELLSSLLLLGILIFIGNKITLQLLLISYAGAQAMRTLLLLGMYWAHFDFPRSSFFSLGELKKLMPFFLLGLGGFLIDKADLLCVSIYLPHSEKASYQIISNLCNMGIVAASMVLVPFTKNIYRINTAAFNVLHKNFNFFGALYTLSFMLGVYVLCKWLFKIEFTVWVYLGFLVNIFAFTLFLPYMFLFTKHNWQSHAVYLMLASGGFTFLLSALLVPKFNQEGAATACALGQIALLLSTRFVAQQLKNKS